ncbi:UDP-N-acetylmuramate dehydrogenase [Myroides sp. 1354]|uniref:UDP-N-acetylmuramate dehydrogenase n=1 Tax=unclassified Myroides TaxID=2642485 RepID=UPI00257618EA|nr:MULTISPECIES: UDP-N-acetylmuramate dehydrogenase [unclassified Myroides]MDM1045349.1 UDP-N-acetylmuramate dehydrogenase [Myroides sp. R163-1]MDM1056414.1 UDP-N-acetylmuramate dehydrogenase [Myroides sp. 1354]MDM1069480.1 UDP-N-acetylmuramate dehydrogenase [Myroides sp. 1372]
MIQENISLKPYNTFGLDVQAKRFTQVNSLLELRNLIQTYPNEPYFILSGGSNMLLTRDVEQLVIKLNIKGIEVIKEDEDFVWVESQASEVWHDFVQWTLARDYGGLENLSLIPGHVGTTPVQNIGAYGVEIKDTMISCKALHIKTLEIEEFSNAACQFDYRESIFKKEAKDQYIILSVVYKLTKKNHAIHTNYGVINSELESWGITTPTIQDVSRAVIAIRSSKLPNPAELGNSGSFFKNPIVSKELFDLLQKKYPAMPFYSLDENHIKIPAGWLIETSGYKGYRIGDAGVHSKQALVLVNYGHAQGIELKKLAETIQNEIFTIFNIHLEAEVNIF